MNVEKLETHRTELANTPELWQFDLLSPREFCQFATTQRIPVFDARTVEKLWGLGLLRADLVTAPSGAALPALTLISRSDGIETYCDARRVNDREEGYGGAFSKCESDSAGIELLFHPFRLYVAHHINRVFRSRVSSTVYFQSSEGLISLAKNDIEHLNRWTASESFAQRFEHWNRVAELAIVLEPVAYETVFHSIRWRPPDTLKALEEKIMKRREDVKGLLSVFSETEINEIRSELCQDAELLDRNKLVHVLLRLTSSHERLKLRDSLGACMQFLCMAEIIRRAAEEAMGQHLPEEDELGFGQWVAGARKSRRVSLGASRIRSDP